MVKKACLKRFKGVNLLDYSSWPLYFFSTLAQSAAGFAALVAVFAVYRLQVNINHQLSLKEETREWLMRNGYINAQDPQEMDFLLGKLEIVIKNSDSLRAHAVPIRAKLLTTRELPKQLPDLLSKPLKLWGVIFLLSSIAIVFIGVLNLKEPYSLGLIALLLVGLSIWALWTSKKMLQQCLTV